MQVFKSGPLLTFFLCLLFIFKAEAFSSRAAPGATATAMASASASASASATAAIAGASATAAIAGTSAAAIVSAGRIGISQNQKVPQLRRLGPGKATLTLVTEEKDSVQAAQYLDAKELDQFIQMQMDEPGSDLEKLKNEIQAKACPEKNEQYSCGDVIWTTPARTSFERGGWMSGLAESTVFIGFRFQGTGYFFQANFAIRIIETVEAKTKENGDYAGEIEKTYMVYKIHPFWAP